MFDVNARSCGRAARLAVFAAVALAGCSHTSLTNLYKDPAYPSAPLDNLLVIAVDHDADQRRLWEDVIAAEFQAHGVLATPSYHAYPALPDTQQVRVILQRDGQDGAVVTHRLAPTQTGGFGSGYDESTTRTRQDYWRGWYQSYYQTATIPASMDTGKKGRYQIDVWSAHDGGRFVWTGTTTEIDPGNAGKLREAVAGQLVPELQRQGVTPGGN